MKNTGYLKTKTRCDSQKNSLQYRNNGSLAKCLNPKTFMYDISLNRFHGGEDNIFFRFASYIGVFKKHRLFSDRSL